MSLPEVPNLLSVEPNTDMDTSFSVAIVKDNLVYQVMNTDGQTAALLLSNPVFVQVDNSTVRIADIYDPASQSFSTQE
jgi:hypothetical protein